MITLKDLINAIPSGVKPESVEIFIDAEDVMEALNATYEDNGKNRYLLIT